MKRKILFALLATTTLLCTACGNEGGDSEVSTPLTVEEVQSALEKKSYENMDILFDKVNYYEGQELVEAHMSLYDITKDSGLDKRQLLDLYVEEVIPSLLDIEEIDTALLFDLNSREVDYAQIIERLDEYDVVPDLIYRDEEAHRYVECVSNWNGTFLSLGCIGNLTGADSDFAAADQVSVEEHYDCRIDDLSDSYQLIDGEKTVAEAKAEIEQYLDAHYPIAGRKNGIKNEVLSIDVGKINGTEYYAFIAECTHSYNGIPFREEDGSADWETEQITPEKCILCETGKVDVTSGEVNCYTEPEVRRTITETMPFAEVLERVSYYLTGETKFQLLGGGLEYRLFKERDEEDKLVGYRMVPYWMFIAKDPNDDTMMKIYVDVETGFVEHREYES